MKDITNQLLSKHSRILHGVFVWNFVSINFKEGAQGLSLQDLNCRLTDPFIQLFTVDVRYLKMYSITSK